MVLYNTTQLDDAKNILEIFVAINDLSGQIFASLFILVLTIFLLVIFRNNGGFEKVAFGVSFIISLISILFWAMGLISFIVLLFPLVFLMIMIFINVFGG
jgi:hypothetical protein